MRAILALTWVLLQANTFVYAHSSILYMSKSEKYIGETVELQCIVQSPRHRLIMWTKDDLRALTTNTALTISDPRFSLLYDTASDTYTLQIRDLQEADSGLYRCREYVASHSHAIVDVRLKVRKQPIISDNSTQPQNYPHEILTTPPAFNEQLPVNATSENGSTEPSVQKPLLL